MTGEGHDSHEVESWWQGYNGKGGPSNFQLQFLLKNRSPPSWGL
jgi:hypothetical protein